MNTHIFLLATLALLPACSFEGGIFDSNTAAKAHIHQLEQDNASLQQQQKQLQKRNQSLKGEQKNVRSQY